MTETFTHRIDGSEGGDCLVVAAGSEVVLVEAVSCDKLLSAELVLMPVQTEA